MENLNTISERSNFIQKMIGFSVATKKEYKELSLALEGKDTNLRIWKGHEKSQAEGYGRELIYIRLDIFQQSSVPLKKEILHYVHTEKAKQVLTQLLEFYEFGNCGMENLDKILEITKDLKYRQIKLW